MAPQQHAIWMAQARAHLKEHRPQTFARLQEEGTLEQHLQETAKGVGEEMRRLLLEGASWEEAWEEARAPLFPEPEAETLQAMPETEGFKAHRELMHGLSNLTMPGEKED